MTRRRFTTPSERGISLLPQTPRFLTPHARLRRLETNVLLRDLAEAQLAGTRKDYVATLTTVPPLIIGDLDMRKLPHTAAEDLHEIVMRRHERASTLVTSNRPDEDWGKLLGDTAVVRAMLGPLAPSHHAHVLTCGPHSWR